MHLFPSFLEDHHYRLQAKLERERERERETLLSRAAQQFSSNTLNLDGQISKGVLSCSDRQAAYCKHVRANAWSCARFHFSSLLNKPHSRVSTQILYLWCTHINTGSLRKSFACKNIRSTVIFQQACLPSLTLDFCTIFSAINCDNNYWKFGT